MSSPMKIEPSTTVNTTDNGLNIGGYDGPFLDTAHELRLYFSAVASAPYTQYICCNVISHIQSVEWIISAYSRKCIDKLLSKRR